MRLRIGATILVLCAAAHADLEHDPVTEFGLRDPAAGRITDTVVPAPFDCPGEHDVKVTFSPVLMPPRFTPVPWLTAPATATFEADDVYHQGDAEGFIRLQSLRLRTYAEKRLGEGE